MLNIYYMCIYFLDFYFLIFLFVVLFFSLYFFKKKKVFYTYLNKNTLCLVNNKQEELFFVNSFFLYQRKIPNNFGTTKLKSKKT